MRSPMGPFWKKLGVVLVLVCALWSALPLTAQTVGNSGRGATPAGESVTANNEVKDENEMYRHSAVVAKLAHMMGTSVETAATSFEVFNFAILALAIGGFLLRTLPATFRARNSRIQKHLVDARTATEEASARMNSVEDRLAALDGQIAEMKAQAERDGAADEARLRAAAEDERAKILAGADQEIAAATMLAQRQLQQYAAELAVDQAARRLVVSAETDRLLVQGFARRLGGSVRNDGKGGEN